MAGFFEAEGRTGALRGTVGRLSNLVLEMRRQDTEEQRYQEGAELRGLQTEAAGLNVQQLRNQIKVTEAEETRLNTGTPIESLRAMFEDPALYDAAKNIADSMGFVNYDDPNLPTITRRDMTSMYEILSQPKVRTDMAITGYSAFEKRYTDLTKAISDYEAQNEGKGKDLQEDKNYQYLVQQRGIAEQKAMQYKQLRDGLLKTGEVPGALEKDVRFLMEDLGMGREASLELARKKSGGQSDDRFLRDVYTKVISAGGSDEEAAVSVDAAKAHFGIQVEEPAPVVGGETVKIGDLEFTEEELRAFGVGEEGELIPTKPKGKKIAPKLEKARRSPEIYKSELKKATKKFNDAKRRLKKLRKAGAQKTVIAHAKKEIQKLSKEVISITNIKRTGKKR